MIESYIDVKVAAELTGEHVSTIRRKATESKYISKSIQDAGAGRGGLKLQILVSSLPMDAQLKFLEKCKNFQNDEISATSMEEEITIDIDMAAYKEKFGDEGMKEFIDKYELVQRALEIELTAKGNKTYLWGELAKNNGVSKRNLDRWVKGFKEFGAKALMKKIDRSNKGKTSSTCQAAKIMLFQMRLDKSIKRRETVCFKRVLEYAESIEGQKACDNCIFREGSEARKHAQEDGLEFAECDMKNKNGLKISRSIATLSRIFKNEIPEEVLHYVFKGRKAWEAKYMHKATREKPHIINEVWFGDHHVLDVFIKDKDGKIVKPWLTAWYDAASGCMVGWCLNTNPNSQTIAEAFSYGVCEKKDFPFYGLPAMVYTDNGKDYRSHAFEGGNIVEKSYGKGMPFNIETDGILKELGIENTHAQAYHGWAKPIERWFGTFAGNYVRELPGWCGNNPKERPEGYDKELKKLVKEDKILTMEELRDWFIKVLNEYHNIPHSGYGGRKPIDIYTEGEKARYDKPSWAVLSILKMEFTERTITTQGITFDNKLYWNKELADRHLINKKVKIRYNRENKDTIIVIHEGKFICAANVKENLKMVREDEDKVAEHIAGQRRQEREVKAKIAQLTGKPAPKELKKSKSNILTGDISEKDKGNVTSIEHEKAMKAYEEAIEGNKKKAADEAGIVDQKFLRTGEEILKKVMNK
ncbi:hypothetical protein D2A34_14425 [Clostridium chromiireducens]|uniref:Integrase catalytic domain-containing protein n=1 Tax=Clostridium chromiireducens TaxID=225345 RepID=A0A399IU32_9CLOT|nr:Mu transposase C-terminal domain-containing protein [Clostridium chromiireducens]RII34336.1 hypothetical protein D2A34_14425 [Clostridium chromiireducens]